ASVDRAAAASAFGGEMGMKGSGVRHGLWSRRLGGVTVATALALAPQIASADEVGESFWTPGSFGSLAATASQPGFSLASTYYHTSTSAGSEVARARLIRIGRAAVEENVSAISISPEDLATVTPSYAFATPVLGGQAGIALTATYGRKRTTSDPVITTAPRDTPFATTRFDTISDVVTGFGDLSPQVSLRWKSRCPQCHDLPDRQYSGRRLQPGPPLEYRHRPQRVGRRRRLHLFQRADGVRIFGGGRTDVQLHQSLHPISERRRCASRLGSVAVPDQAAPDRLGGLSLQSSELRWRVRRSGRLLPVARCGCGRPARLHHPHGRAGGKRERQGL